MKLRLPLPPSRCLATSLLIICLLGLQMAYGTSPSATDKGVRLLQAELPAKTTLLKADCEQLAAAVGKATLAHQPDALAILRVALTRGIQNGGGKLPCACATRIFSVSVAAAPAQTSVLLDLATDLYPTCASELASALHDHDRVAFDYKDRVVDDKNGPARDAANSSDPSGVRQTGSDPTTVADPGDLSDRDFAGLGYGDNYGFGTGLGPGFPGSPGFFGSSPSGGLALPPVQVTSVING